MNVLPLFRSNYSLGLSILPLVEEKEYIIKEDAPVNILSILKQHNINDLYLYERDPAGLIQAQKLCDKLNINLHYGVEVKIWGNTNWFKVGLWLKNNDNGGYAKYCQLLTKINTQENFTFTALRDNWNQDLLLTIPMYDSFLYNNCLRLNHLESPDFNGLDPLFFIEQHGLPFDEILKEKVENFCEKNNYKMVRSHTICYYKDEDIDSFLSYRIICSRKFYANSSLNKPNIDFMSSNEFSFESYQRLLNE